MMTLVFILIVAVVIETIANVRLETFTVWFAWVVGAHILEETVMGFTEFFNVKVLNGTADDPVGPAEAWIKDRIGLLAALLFLLLIGRECFAWMAIGFIAADALQHSIYTIRERDYTPGMLTACAYIVLVIWSVLVVEDVSVLCAILGALGLGANFLLAYIRS